MVIPALQASSFSSTLTFYIFEKKIVIIHSIIQNTSIIINLDIHRHKFNFLKMSIKLKSSIIYTYTGPLKNERVGDIL